MAAPVGGAGGGGQAAQAQQQAMAVQDAETAKSTMLETQMMKKKNEAQNAKTVRDTMTKITDMKRESTNFAFSTSDKAAKRTAQSLRA